MSSKGGWFYDFAAPVDIHLPFVAAEKCMKHSPRGLVCTRRKGHRARHAACGINNKVIEVWS
jgi:hypothetical protein